MLKKQLLKKPEWKKVVLEEMKAMDKNGTWEVVSKPKGKTLVGCKRVFTVKYHSNGTIE